ncbi:MAG: D-aminoacylase, partial [Phycisphaerae bacterium]
VRFAAALDDPKKCPLLGEASIREMLAPPPGPVGHRPDGRPKREYYACGWNVRTTEGRPGRCTKSHSGLLAGSSTLLVCGEEGVNWAVLFNSDAKPDGSQYAGLVRPLLQRALGEITTWPDEDLFGRSA